MQYIIEGPNVASGEIQVAGAKNFAIKALAAALLIKGKVYYRNLPSHTDVIYTLNILKELGCLIETNFEEKTCVIDASKINNSMNNVKNTNMIMFLFGAGLIHRFDEIKFPFNNGCNLGTRAYDFHIMAFESLGAKYEENSENSHCFSKKHKLKGCTITLPYSSVGATETSIFLAVLAEGITKICNAAIEPEIQALVTTLITLGACIFFESDRTIIVYGVKELERNQVIEIHGDLLEAATWAVLAAASSGQILVKGFIPELIGSFLGMFTLLGGGCKRISENSMIFYKKSACTKSILFETGVFPALRTDLQPLLAVLAAAQKNCVLSIHETVYDTRVDCVNSFKYFGVEAFGFSNCFGSTCRFHNKNIHSAVIKGISNLKAPKQIIEIKSIRNGMAEIILACISKGKTIINNVELVERGYCKLVQKLQSLDINIQQT